MRPQFWNTTVGWLAALIESTGQLITSVYGKQADGTVTAVKVDADGHPQVDVLSAAGTVTANQGTAGAAAWPVKDGGFNTTTAHKVTSSADATGIIDITDAPTASQKRVLVDLLVSVDTAMNVTVLEETSGTVMHGPIYLPANGTVQITPRATPMSKLATADKKYRLDASVAGNITVETWSYSEA